MHIENIEKLLMSTKVGASMEKLCCAGMEFGPKNKSVCFLILLCSVLLTEPNVVENNPAWCKLRVNRQHVVEHSVSSEVESYLWYMRVSR